MNDHLEHIEVLLRVIMMLMALQVGLLVGWILGR